MHRITVLEGDGIGPEITRSALAVLRAACAGRLAYEVDPRPFGGAAIDRTGEPLPAETLAACRGSDAVLLAAVGGPRWDGAPHRPEQGLLDLRRRLGLFANIRPTRIAASAAARSPLRTLPPGGVDLVIVRELTSGLYFGRPRSLSRDEAVDTLRYARPEVERILRAAFRLASSRRRHVTVVDKANVLATSRLWRQVAREIAADFPAIDLDFCYVDAAAMRIVARPGEFDVIATENMFGDILSDEAAQITGSLGTIPSMSAGERDGGPALYEPIHGSAPDIAGRGIADPIGMIASAAMMLRHSLDRPDLAERIDAAVDAALAAGVATPDLGGRATTDQFTRAVVAALDAGDATHTLDTLKEATR